MSTTISQSMLLEFDMEMSNTRKTLERVPEGKSDFRPHAKSMPMGRLAGHLTEMPMWAMITLGQDELDVSPNSPAQFQPYVMTSRTEALAKFDADVKKAREMLARTTDEVMMKPWSLKNGAHTLMSIPRVSVMRSFVMNHMVHHRAQLGVYLRMNDAPVPSLYGPSADEAPPWA